MATADIGGDGTTTVRKLEGFGVLVISTAVQVVLDAHATAPVALFCDEPCQQCLYQKYAED